MEPLHEAGQGRVSIWGEVWSSPQMETLWRIEKKIIVNSD